MKIQASEIEQLLRMGEEKINELRDENKRLKQENSDLRKEMTRLQTKYECS